MRERIMNVMKKKEDNKGFTLVELIVVIVILAILAALLIPGLLRWIDKAKEEQYVLEARNIYLATEAKVAQEYAAGTSQTDMEAKIKAAVSDISDLADVKISTNGIESITFRTGTDVTDTQKFEITGMKVKFTSADTKEVTMELKDGSWQKATTP